MKIIISEPRDVRVQDSDLTSATLCWFRPTHGDVTGYVILYRNLNDSNVPLGGVEIRNTANQICSTVSPLAPWTRYMTNILEDKIGFH